MVSRDVEHDGAVLLITDGSVALEDPGMYDCINCQLKAEQCSCGDGKYREMDMPEMPDEEWADLNRLCSLPENELNAELAALGIDPIECEKQSLEFVAKLSAGADASKFGA